MSLEIKALAAAILAGLFVLGAVFGLSALIRSRQGPSQNNGYAQTMAGKMTAMSEKMPALTATQLVHGQKLFSQNCASCHGAGGQGAFGPDVRGIDQTDTRAINTIKKGVKGRMPAFASKLSDPDLQALVAYLHSLKK